MNRPIDHRAEPNRSDPIAQNTEFWCALIIHDADHGGLEIDVFKPRFHARGQHRDIVVVHAPQAVVGELVAERRERVSQSVAAQLLDPALKRRDPNIEVGAIVANTVVLGVECLQPLPHFPNLVCR